jgi:hypothetical protein
MPRSTFIAEFSWSQGNRTYYYLQLKHNGQAVFDYWATECLSASPKVWIQDATDTEVGKLITYQPTVYPTTTPYGEVVSGYRVWLFDGRSFRAQTVGMCPLNLWLRSPIPIQD